MEDKFIYVFSTEDRDKLIAAHYRLIKTNCGNKTQMYVFEKNKDLEFAVDTLATLKRFVLSDVLTF